MEIVSFMMAKMFVTSFVHAATIIEVEERVVATEVDGMATIRLSNDISTSSFVNPVIIRVTPLTVDQALNQGIIDSYPTPADDITSPSRASMCR